MLNLALMHCTASADASPEIPGSVCLDFLDLNLIAETSIVERQWEATLGILALDSWRHGGKNQQVSGVLRVCRGQDQRIRQQLTAW
jgi:hypothetical protein